MAEFRQQNNQPVPVSQPLPPAIWYVHGKREVRRDPPAQCNGNAAAYASYVATVQSAGIAPRPFDAWIENRNRVQARRIAVA